MEKQILLFVSSRRNLYKRLIYNILSYPEDFLMYFVYDKKWMPYEIWKDPIGQLKGKEAIVVAFYTDKIGETSEIEEKFMPLRKVQIIDVEKEGSILHIYFKLFDEWGDIDDLNKHNSLIKRLPDRPRYGKKHSEGKFVLSDLTERISFSASLETWEGMISELATKKGFTKGIFYRFNGIKDSSGNYLKLKKINNKKKGYVITEDKSYTLDISFNFGKEPPRRLGGSLFQINGANLNVIPESTDMEFRVHKESFVLSSEDYIPLTMVYTKIVSPNLIGPTLEIPIKINKSKWRWIPYILTMSGIGIIALLDPTFINYFDPELAKSLSNSIIYVKLIGTLLTGVGLALLKK